MIYGILAEKDVKLSSVVRALKEEPTPKKVEDRLSRMLSSDGLERRICTASSPQRAPERSTGTRSSSWTRPTCRSPARREGARVRGGRKGPEIPNGE